MSLFSGDGLTYLNACVGRNGGPYTFYDYSLGYYESGNNISEQLFINNDHIDLKVYPIVFLYRQYIELMIKHLYLSASSILLGEPKRLGNHKIYDKWESLLAIMKAESQLELDDKDFTEISKMIKEFEDIDPKGETFRYPISNDGVLHLQDIIHINIKILYDNMKKIYECFEDLDLRLSVIKEWSYNARDY